MNSQFLFRMQNQEGNQKRAAQPDFKVRMTEQQRPTSSGAAFQRSTHMQMDEYESENMTSLHAKLHQEANKIRKWKIQTEMDIKEKDKKLSSASTQIETMKKSMIELQLDNESLSSKMQEEIDSREEVVQKISTTRELCNILKMTTTSLEDRMLRCETEKTELKYVGRETSQQLEELSNKFENLCLSSENNTKDLLLKVEKERKESQERLTDLTKTSQETDAMMKKMEKDLKEKTESISDLQAALLEKNSTLEKLNNSLSQLEDTNKLLQKEVVTNETAFKESALRILTIQDENNGLQEKFKKCEADLHYLEKSKEEILKEMTESCAKYEKDLLSTQEQVNKLEKELEDKHKKNENFQAELQEAENTIEKLKSSRDILTLEKTELQMQIDVQHLELTNLRTDMEEKGKEIHRLDGEMNVLLKKLDRENLCKIQLQGKEKDLEAKISALKSERNEQSTCIHNLEKTVQEKQSEVNQLLSKERVQVENFEANIESKEKELEEEKTRVKELTKELNHALDALTTRDSDLLSKETEIEKLQNELQTQISLKEQCQSELDELKDKLEEFKNTFEEEKRKTDELSNQLKDMNLENKENGKSLVSQQQKFTAQTKQNKELAKELKSLKADLNKEKKKTAEKEADLELLENELKALKDAESDLIQSKNECEKEMESLKDQCSQERKASEDAMIKAKEMQEIAKKETENAKALTANQLAEMMETLDSYKQSSEKILAEKDVEIKSLKNKLEAHDTENKNKMDELKDEHKRLSSNVSVLSSEKEDLCQKLMETADENQSLKKKVQDLENKIREDEENMHKGEILKAANTSSESNKGQTLQQNPPVVPVTPQKQILRTPKSDKLPLQAIANQSILKTPQRSFLRTTTSVPKRRKVAFLPDDQDVPSSSDDLMELEVEMEESDPVSRSKMSPLVSSRTPKLSYGMESACRMTPKRFLTPISKPIQTSTPKQMNPELTSTPHKLNTAEPKSKSLRPDNSRTPNIRNVPAKKSKFFTVSPKEKVANRTRIKDKPKLKTDGQFSWFDLDSVYEFGPED